MKILQAFKEGDTIPEGAKFVCKEERKEQTPYKMTEKLTHAGLFSDTYTTYAHYRVHTYFIYEIEIPGTE